MQSNETISIRPSVRILSALKNLNYKAWYALAEFVDNSLDSYLLYKKDLQQINPNYQLRVEVDINAKNKTITVKDNAAGIHERDFDRALKTAAPPPNSAGLSEFGMGMKSAACWFANKWSIETSAIGETLKRSVEFNISHITEGELEELIIKKESGVAPENHYTIVTLHDVHESAFPQKRTVSKIKEHLASIYRDFIRSGILTLRYDGSELHYNEPKILVSGLSKTVKERDKRGLYDSSGEKKACFETIYDKENICWKIDIPENFELREGLVIEKGFVAIREKGSTSKAGLALLRRGRVILGSGDDGYRPREIFGQTNSFRYQRLFGELHVKGFEVSHTKDGFKNDKDMELFVELLKSYLHSEELPLLDQAELYRKKPSHKDFTKTANTVGKKMDSYKKKLEEHISSDFGSVEEDRKEWLKPLIEEEKKANRSFHANFEGSEWLVDVQLTWDKSILEWIEVGDQFITNADGKNTSRRVGIRLNLAHRFSMNFAGSQSDKVDSLTRIAIAIGLAEVIARSSGIKSTSYFRKIINDLLTKTLSEHEYNEE